MKLSDAQHQYIAQRAQWYFDIDPRSIDDRGDSVVYTGDGVDDLDSAIRFVSHYPKVRISAEVGSAYNFDAAVHVPDGASFPKYMLVDVEDLYAIRAAFVSYYGTVSKPSHVDPTGAALKLS